jgi:hypothetical protein
MSVLPKAADATQILAGGTSVQVFPGNIAGGLIQNPLSNADQGVTAENLYIDPTGINPGSAPGAGNGTCFVLQPGQTWSVIPNQSTPTRANAATTGHKFSGVQWIDPSAG